MAKVTITQLKNWFKTGLKPTQDHFYAWLDSYRHKDDAIAASEVDGLGALLDQKADADAVAALATNYVGNNSDLDDGILNTFYPIANYPIGTTHTDTNSENVGFYVRVTATEWMWFQNKAALQASFDFLYLSKTDAAYFSIVDLGDVSGNVEIDWSLAVKFKMNLIGNVTFTFSNIANYEEVKVQGLQITSESPTNAITWANGIDVTDFDSTPIDFALATTRNYVSVRNLDGSEPYFQSSNKVKII